MYTCQFCGKSCKTPGALGSHKAKHSRNGEVTAKPSKDPEACRRITVYEKKERNPEHGT